LADVRNPQRIEYEVKRTKNPALWPVFWPMLLARTLAGPARGQATDLPMSLPPRRPELANRLADLSLGRTPPVSAASAWAHVLEKSILPAAKSHRSVKQPDGGLSFLAG
jgi:hypothetical protein